MSIADELYSQYRAKKDKKEEKDTPKSLADELYLQHKANKPDKKITNVAEPEKEEETPRSTVDFRSRFEPMLPNAAIINSQLYPQAAQNAIQERKTQQYIQSSPSVKPNANVPNNYGTIKADYDKKVADINASDKDDNTKNDYLQEAQLEYEVKLLEERARNQEIVDKGIPGVVAPKKQYDAGARKNVFASDESKDLTEAKELLESKRAQLDKIQKSNRINSILSDPEVSSLVADLSAEEMDKENTAITSMFNPSYGQGRALTSAVDSAMGNESLTSKAISARQKLIDMGYDPDELLEQYTLNKNKVVTEELNQEFKQFGKEHPVLATALSFPANAASGMGVGAIAKAALTGREVDPNSPYFIYSNITEGMREGVTSDMGSIGKFAYNIGTTLGDMTITQAVAGGNPLTYKVLMASQAAASSAKEGAQKGYSVGHIFINSATSAAFTALATHLGYDKVFNPKTAKTAKELFKNMLKGFASEGLEELSEDALNDIVENITSIIFTGSSETDKRINELMAQGMTEEQAISAVVDDKLSQYGQTLLISGITGGVMAGGKSLLGYIGSVVEREINKKIKAPTAENQPLTAEGMVAPETVPTVPQNAENQPILTDTKQNIEQNVEQEANYANEFDNLFDEDVSEEAETPSEEVNTTVNEDDVNTFDTSNKKKIKSISAKIKSDYDTEAKADLTEKTEPYSSGNAAVDAMLNPNGKLDRKITIDEQAEQKLIDTAKNLFNRTVIFKDNIKSGNGYLDPDTGNIVLSRNSDKKHVTVFGHEYMHTLEGTQDYYDLAKHLKDNSSYIKSKLEEAGGDWNTLVQNKITEYENALGKKLTESQAESEIFADAIAEEFFSDYDSLESLAVNNRPLFTKFKQWFYKTFFGGTTGKIYSDTAAARKTYALMLRAEKAANGVQNSESAKRQYSVVTMDDGKQYVKADRQVIVGDNPKEWGKQITSYINDSVRNGRDVIVYAKDGDALTITRDTAGKAAFRNTVTMKNGKKRAMTDEEYATKLRAESHVDELAQVSTRGNKVVPDTKNHPFAKDGFNYRTAYFMDNDGQYYQITLSVGKNGAVNTIYNVGKLKKEAKYSLSGSKAVTDNSATMRSASNDNISNFTEDVNNKFSYSAKSPEVIEKLTTDFGYSEASANNLYKAVSSLAKSAGSTADIGELTYAVSSALDKARRGEITDSDIDGITNLIAESDQTSGNDKAYSNLRDEVKKVLDTDYRDGKTAINKLRLLCEKYGELKNGVPKSTDGKTKVRGVIASFVGTNAVQKDYKLKAQYAKDIADGKYDYEVFRMGKKAKQFVNSIKFAEDVPAKVEQEYRRLKDKMIKQDYKPKDILEATALTPLLKDYLSADDFVEYVSLISQVGTTSGQIVAALRYIKDFTPSQKLKSVLTWVDNYNRKLLGEDITEPVFDDNGGITDGSDPSKHKLGLVAKAQAKRRSKYTKLEIPKQLQENLVNAETDAETKAAMAEINDYISRNIRQTWWDKVNALRYLAMLSNPKTAIRNTLGNVAGYTSARLKDVTASALYKVGVGKEHGADNIRTSSVRTTKVARQAAFELLSQDDSVQSLMSSQDKYVNKVNPFSSKPAETSAIMKKAGEAVPMLGLILENRTVQSSPFKNKFMQKVTAANSKMLDDTPFKILRAHSVLSQAIYINQKLGNIENVEDFVNVALGKDTPDLDTKTKENYARLYDEFARTAAQEGDEATFREENAFVNKLNKFRQSDKILGRIANVLVDGIVPFVKTPANVTKRAVEYSPIGLGWQATYGRYKLSEGTINRNDYINKLAKGITGTGVFLLGGILGAFGLISAGDDDEEEEAERNLLGEQEYSMDIGNGTYTLDWLTPASISLFMGAKVWDIISSQIKDGEPLSWAETLSLAGILIDSISSISEPMFNQTMLDGIEGAFETIGRESIFSTESGAALGSLVTYCVENWAQQFIPSVLGAVARTADDTVRGYYKEKGKEETLLGDLMVGAKKKIPFVANTTPAKLDMWGQPIKSDSLGERFIENFISPGYYQESTSDRATKALHKFATANDIAYTDVIPQEVPNYFKLPNKTEITLTAEEYEKYAGIVGKARKEAVEKYLVRGEPAEVEYNYTVIKSSLKSGRKSEKRTFKGNIATATNRYGWSPTNSSEGYIQFNDKGKAIGTTAASNEEFRKMLFDEVIKQVTDEAEAKAQEEIMKARNNK